MSRFRISATPIDTQMLRATLEAHGAGACVCFEGWVRDNHEGRVVRDASALGKYWMEHPHYTVGDALVVGDPRIDPLFFSEIWGPSPITLTYRNLDPNRRYVVQIGHGEPRSCCAGRFSNNDFVLDNGTVLQVPSFQLGNGVARDDPPAADDLALVTVEIFGTSTFTYNMRTADGNTRSSSSPRQAW